MNANQLLEHFHRIGDAPDAIPRLRRFILDLAVRGKLVPQDPRDEPAAELLKRIAKEKARFGLKQQVSLLGSDEMPFELPQGWSWSRLGEVCSKTGSGSTPRGGQAVYKSTGIPFLRSQNVYDAGLLLDDVAYIDTSTHARMAGTAVKPKDLLLNITGGSMGRCCRVPDVFGEANVSQHVAIIRTALPGIEDFLHRLVLSPYSQAFIFDEQTGAGRGGLPKNRMDRIAVALPPLAEQHRIVAKVDELMSLCDRLEAAQDERETTRDRLTAASLASLNAPDPNPAIFANHARFALYNIGALTMRPDQVKQLRQTILNLAMRGKLVPQDSNDEPASELLKRIAGVRAQLVAARKIKQTKELYPLNSEEVASDVPAGWSATRLGIAYDVRDGTHDTPKYVEVGYPMITSKNLSSGYLSFEDVRLISEHDYLQIAERSGVDRGDILLAMIGSIGNPVIVDTDEPFSIKNVALFKYFDPDLSCPGFLRFFLQHAANEMKSLAAGGLQPFVSLGFLRAYPIALPPLAEQHRIVAKVDALMALCDRLETSLAAAAATRRRLLDALLAEALGRSSLKLKAAE